MHFEIFGRKKEVSSESIAVISGQRTLTYSRFTDEIEKHSLDLASLGVKEGMHIAVLCPNNIDFIILLFALWKIRAVPVPINIRLLDEEIEKLVEHSEAEFIFVHLELKERLSIKKKVLFPSETPAFILNPDNNNIKFPVSFNPENVALILYTSGTTGRAKGVMLTYNNLLSSAVSADYVIRHSPGDKWLSSLPFYHIGGLSIPIRAFLSGATVILPDSLKAESIKDAILKFEPTLASFVSTTLKQLLEAGTKPNPALRLVLLGGGPIENDLAVKAARFGWKIAKVYGSTETSSLVTSLLVNNFPEKISSAGKALPDIEITIVDENGKNLPAYETGEVVVSSKSVMKGYWNNPEQTGDKLIAGSYYSGDLGYLDSEGFLFIESRRTDLIVSGGENINPIEVEEAIIKYPGIKEVCVFPLKDKEWGQTVAAAIVPFNEGIEIEKLKTSLKSKISPFKIPRKIFLTKALPKTSLGKIKREMVRQTFENTDIEQSGLFTGS